MTYYTTVISNLFVPFRRVSEEDTIPGTHVLHIDAVRTFVTAGNSLFTIFNTRTQKHLTFKVKSKKNSDGTQSPLFVSGFVGNDNTSDYGYIGYITDSGEFRPSAKAVTSTNPKRTQCVAAFTWFWNRISTLPEFVQVRHHNRCGACNRILTVPESIDQGLGPICAKKMPWVRIRTPRS